MTEKDTARTIVLDLTDALNIDNAIKCFVSWNHPPELVESYVATLRKLHDMFADEFGEIPWILPIESQSWGRKR